ncbi:MAG: hypothetical protein LBK63_10610 [Treponema sp.]|jgi:hypothetical protein|nr:hypothetical protein [Treponema sp.]
MGFFPAQRLRFIFVAYLVLSVMGEFTFTAAEDLAAFDFWKSKTMPDGSIISMDVDYTIDCFAGYAVKTRGYLSLPSRRSMRILAFFGMFCAGSIASYSGIKIAGSIKTPNTKNTLLLKLRL